MSEMQDYKSRLSDPASRKLGTFSYLPPMDADQIRRQIQYIVDKGWNPAIEHTEPEQAGSVRISAAQSDSKRPRLKTLRDTVSPRGNSS